jgi:hypothetical protein
MPSTWQLIHTRGLQTLAIWREHAPDYAVGSLTLDDHTATIESLPELARTLANEEAALDAARASRDAYMVAVRDLTIHMPRLLENDLPENHPLHRDIVDLRQIEPESFTSIASRGQRALSLWKKGDAARATMGLEPLVVDDTTLDKYREIIEVLPATERAVEAERADIATARTTLHTAMHTADVNNKRWFKAWQKDSEEGTPARDALSQIDADAAVEVSAALVIVGGTRSAPDTIVLDYEPGSGANAAVRQLHWQLPGETSFPHGADAHPPQQVVSNPAFAKGAVVFRTRTFNSAGETFGPAVTVEL